MQNFELISFPTDNELASAAANAWLDEVEVANHARKSQCVAFSGGRIAQKFFSAITTSSRVRNVSLDSVHFFWADERCVPPVHAESNYRIARELLFAPLNIPETQVHRIRGEITPEAAAKAAEAEFRRVVPVNRRGHSILDLIFLGMGEDGHVASLFPGESEEAISSKAIYCAVTASKPPPRRISLGYPPIAAARQVWLLASGAGKEKALSESIRPDGNTPLARVLQQRKNTRIFSDIEPV